MIEVTKIRQSPIVTKLVTFMIAVVGLNFLCQRVKNQEKQVEQQVKQADQQREQIDLQIQQRVDKRFTTAISLLGSNESSARSRAIYALYHLAIDDDKDGNTPLDWAEEANNTANFSYKQ